MTVDIATCGTCGRSWNFTAYHWPATLCPFCYGDEREAAEHEVFPDRGWDTDALDRLWREVVGDDRP